MATWLDLWKQQETWDTPNRQGFSKPNDLPNCPHCQGNHWEILRTITVTDRIPFWTNVYRIATLHSNSYDGLEVKTAYVQCQGCLETVGWLDTDDLTKMFIYESTVRHYLVYEKLIENIDDEFGFAMVASGFGT